MLYKRKNSKNWWFKYTDANGERIRRSTQTTDRKKAQELADKYKASSWDQIKLGVKPSFVWEDAVVRWMKESEKKTKNDDLCMFRYLDNFLTGMRLDVINRGVIEAIVQDKLKTASPGRANRITSLIRAVLNKAKDDWDWIDKVPSIRRLKENGSNVRWLSQEEKRKLLNECPKHIKAMVIFSLSTGLRESNVTGLKWSQVDLIRKVVTIEADQTKAGRPIGIPLNDEAAAVLTEQVGKHPAFVFCYLGNPIKKAGSTAWKSALKRAGVHDFRWHDLRHTWASWHVQSGTPLNVMKELGSWKSYDMVLRYAHLAPEHLARYASNISVSN